MYMRACPPDSLLRENESSVRDLPLVKQNFIIRDFIMFHDALSSPKEKDFLSGILSSLTIIFRLSVGKKWVHKCRYVILFLKVLHKSYTNNWFLHTS